MPDTVDATVIGEGIGTLKNRLVVIVTRVECSGQPGLGGGGFDPACLAGPDAPATVPLRLPARRGGRLVQSPAGTEGLD